VTSTLARLANYALLALCCNLCTPRLPAAEAVSAPTPRTAAANVHVLPTAFEIPGLHRTRTVRIYLPPGYEQGGERYPVLYMHDGQKLFDEATAYAGEWGVDETLNALASSRGLKVIVVGVDNGGAERINELTAWDGPEVGRAQGEQYMAFIVEVLKPWIDCHYRTRPDPRHTAIMGSSRAASSRPTPSVAIPTCSLSAACPPRR
jgi:predicted alpha/beta superfamily hydrolase